MFLVEQGREQIQNQIAKNLHFGEEVVILCFFAKSDNKG